MLLGTGYRFRLPANTTQYRRLSALPLMFQLLGFETCGLAGSERHYQIMEIVAKMLSESTPTGVWVR